MPWRAYFIFSEGRGHSAVSPWLRHRCLWAIKVSTRWWSNISPVCKVCLVYVAVAAVIVYRIIMTIDYCEQTSAVGCLLLTSVLSAVLNAAAILILGKVSYKFCLLRQSMWADRHVQTVVKQDAPPPGTVLSTEAVLGRQSPSSEQRQLPIWPPLISL